MTCIELYERIMAEFLEPDTKILTILPEESVKALLETPDQLAPEWLLQACRDNAVKDSFEEKDVQHLSGELPRKEEQKTDKTTLEEKLERATALAEVRNQRRDA